MAKKASNKNLIYLVVGGAVVGAIALSLTAPDSGSSITSKPPVKHALPATASSEDTITSEDLTVRFDRVPGKPKDAFKPLIYHVSTAGGGANSADQSAVPADFTGGEGDWGFTGTVQMDGTTYANLDNTKTQEFAQVKRGDHWKKCTVGEVGTDYVVLEGPVNSKKLLMPTVDTGTAKAATTDTNASLMPVMPQLNGDIGAQPDTIQPDAGGMQQNFGGGRRNRGGGRGGRGRGGPGGGGGAVFVSGG